MMDEKTLGIIGTAYGWGEVQTVPVHSGLINTTLKVTVGRNTYLLQQVNTNVFHHPEQIDENLGMLAGHLRKYTAGYLFTAPVAMIDGTTLLVIDNRYYRVFDWVHGSHTIDVVSQSGQPTSVSSQLLT